MYAVPIVAIIATFTTLLTIAVIYFRTRHTERMALIESGADSSIFYPKRKPQGSLALKIGLLLTGIGLGFFAGFMMDSIMHIGDEIIFPLVMIGGGLGLILSYGIERRQKLDDSYTREFKEDRYEP